MDNRTKAREFIESVIEINRKHGMGSVPQSVIDIAIRDAERALKGISPKPRRKRG